MTQVAAEALGLPIERVTFMLGDTRLPRAPVHGGSMTMASVGSVVQAACGKARGGSDLTDATRRIGQLVEASAEHCRPPPMLPVRSIGCDGLLC